MAAGDLQTSQSLILADLEATNRLAERLAGLAAPGLVVLLDGPVGAGKTTLARATIQELLARDGRQEDVPSPTFTLVQTYQTGAFETWHADLYRLSDPAELIELGLEAAFQTGFCLIEWPDRMAPLPDTQPMLRVTLEPSTTETARNATLTAQGIDLTSLMDLAQ